MVSNSDYVCMLQKCVCTRVYARTCILIPTRLPLHVPFSALLICSVSFMSRSDSEKTPPPTPPHSFCLSLPCSLPPLSLIPTAVRQKVYTSINIMLCARRSCVMEEALPFRVMYMNERLLDGERLLPAKSMTVLSRNRAGPMTRRKWN